MRFETEGDGQLDAAKMSSVAPELSLLSGSNKRSLMPQPRLEVGHERQYFQ